MDWNALVEKVIRDAVTKDKRPVPGSKLRIYIEQEAHRQGEKFPPEPGQSFSAFLRQFSEKIYIQRRPGQDFLVVPADDLALLSNPTTGERTSRLKKDLYWALTHIPNKQDGLPHYLRSSDSVTWYSSEDTPPPDAAPIPATTLEQEIADRKQFAEAMSLPDGLKEAVAEALQSSTPLGGFTYAIRSYGQAHNWHTFRMDLLINRLRAWAKQHDIPWQDSWIERGTSTPRPVQTSSASEAASLRDFFNALSESMFDTDLSRMTIPLDLVLRAWGRRGS